MAFYTYQIGEGDLETGKLTVAAHSMMIAAATLAEAIGKAKAELKNAPAWEKANLVRLLDDHTDVVWFRPVDGASDA